MPRAPKRLTMAWLQSVLGLKRAACEQGDLYELESGNGEKVLNLATGTAGLRSYASTLSHRRRPETDLK